MVVTVRDVARAAGVSISTVSRALSVPDKVAVETRERVAAVATELGYQPNRAAAGLRAGRTGAVGLLVPDLSNPYFATVAQGVAAAARDHGLGVFVVDFEESPELEVELLRSLAHQTDGLILASPRSLAADRSVVQGKPVVVINQDPPLAVGTDYLSGTALAVEHLVELGHRRIAYVAGPPTSWTDRRRREGLDRATDEQWVEVTVVGPQRPTVEGGAAAAQAVLDAGVTAAITFNDVVAVGLTRELQERGVRVPQDLSVVGFDDTFLAELVTPALTSVGADLRELGRQAADLLAGRLAAPHDPAPAEATLLPMTLAVRSSTAIASR